ncbi:MAG TPA: zf-HC2 domain-containing protein [Gemmatimonadales bacterium]|nr:zf-HC2 domain-containing protein [Gemmatimonadales bacterium]
MTAHLNEELSAYLNGELAGAELERVEAHLGSCAQCSHVLEDLRRVVRRARALDDKTPERDLWGGIASRIGAAASQPQSPTPAAVLQFRPRPRRFSFSAPQLAAAAVAIMTLSAATASLLVRSATPTATDAARLPAAEVRPVGLPLQPLVESYDAAIADLERTFAAHRYDLDTATARVLEQSLALIDVAIAQARAALARDPNNLYLNGHLRSALDRKLDVLRRAVALPAS